MAKRKKNNVRKVQKYDRKGTFTFNTILPLIPDIPNRKTKNKTDIDGDIIKMNSDRYQVFKDNPCCVMCNIRGVYFAKERSLNKDGEPQCDTYHLNLYAQDVHGNDVLMTKDHIVPRSKGGADKVENYQTMCSPCNNKKGNTLLFSSPLYYCPDIPEVINNV